ncbi:MAG: hypothetical protein AB202_01355 [Parcubacteria bacterium C7867-007]|nr:MAG: hypothetical protein AB202_01355 [Parcubacteria bacterium C7867-007]
MQSEKDFDTWNQQKKFLEKRSVHIFAHNREVWWCALGLNIGAEIDGKNSVFERPVLVLKVYNSLTLLVLPVTSKKHENSFHHPVQIRGKLSWVKLTQVRVISSKRLLRKIGSISEDDFRETKQALLVSLI